MKRFLLFECPHYYPSGGSADVVGTYDNLEELYTYIFDRTNNLYEILDLQERVWIPC